MYVFNYLFFFGIVDIIGEENFICKSVNCELMLISYFVDDVYDLVSSLYKCDEEVFKYVF